MTVITIHLIATKLEHGLKKTLPVHQNSIEFP